MLNRVHLIGRLGQDPEVRYTQSGTAVGNFSLATSRKWKDKNSGQWQEKTAWHRIVVWGKTAENCQQYIKKGSKIYVEGEIEYKQWEKEGVKQYSTEINANQIQFLDSKGEGQGQGGQQGAPTSQPNSQPAQGQNFTSDDIPF